NTSSLDPEDWLDNLSPSHYFINSHPGDDAQLPHFSAPMSATRPRADIHTLDKSAAQQLSDAYTFLAKDPATKVKPSLGLQTFIHHFYCSDTERGVHNSKGGLFFAFHRALLVFHERLLQWTLEKCCKVNPNTARNFRLPYWDPRSDQGVYSDPKLTGLYRDRGP